jgi:hypothetical protein
MCSRCKTNKTNCNRAAYLCSKSLVPFQNSHPNSQGFVHTLLLKLLRMLLQGTEDLFDDTGRKSIEVRLVVRICYHRTNPLVETLQYFTPATPSWKEEKAPTTPIL